MGLLSRLGVVNDGFASGVDRHTITTDRHFRRDIDVGAYRGGIAGVKAVRQIITQKTCARELCFGGQHAVLEPHACICHYGICGVGLTEPVQWRGMRSQAQSGSEGVVRVGSAFGYRVGRAELVIWVKATSLEPFT